MNELPRQKLCELIAKYGESLCDEPLRLEGLLRDLCGEYRLEINLFVHALKEGIASDLRNSSVAVHTDLLIGRLSKRLQDHHAVNEEIARWVVESWALALGKISEHDLTKQPTPSAPRLQRRAPVSRPQPSAPLKAPSAGERIPSSRQPQRAVTEISSETASERSLRKLRWALVLSVVVLFAGFAALWYFAIFLPQQRPQRTIAQSATPEPAAQAQKEKDLATKKADEKEARAQKLAEEERQRNEAAAAARKAEEDAAAKKAQEEAAAKKAEEEATRARSKATNATKEEPFVNSLGMKFVPVPGTQVLFSIWDTRVQDYQVFAKMTEREWAKADFEQGSTHPAVNVNWEDAKAFCAWLTERERKEGKIGPGQEYRLPTDAEWSVAVGLRHQEGRTRLEKTLEEGYPWGTQWPPPKGAGNYGPRLGVDGYKYTSPVGSFEPNKFGLYDMGGNVWQWCEDWYDDQHRYRVLRGSCWGDDGFHPDRMRSSSRFGGEPGDRSNAAFHYDGFRCVLAVGSSR